MDKSELFGSNKKYDLKALDSDQKKILLNLTILWSLRSDLEIGQLLDNITCCDNEVFTLHDVKNEEFIERLSIQIEAFSSIKKSNKEAREGDVSSATE